MQIDYRGIVRMTDSGGGRVADEAAGPEDGWVGRRLAQRIARTAASEGQPAGGRAEAGLASPSNGDKRAAERRRDERRTGIASTARILFHGREHEVTLLNLSRRGCMIGCEIRAACGDRIAVEFPECNPIHGTVRWVEDGRTGIEFALQTAVLIPSHWRLAGGRDF
jgi:hypothetical protein